MNCNVLVLLTFNLVVFSTGSLLADEKSNEDDKILEQIKREETKDVLDHLERRLLPVKYFDPIKLEANKSVNVELKLKEHDIDIKPCNADIFIDYLQFDTRARVDAAIDNNDCTASSGQYEVQLQLIDKNNNLQSIEHVESWTRDNDTQYKSRKYYDIGSNVELFRATARRLTCMCAQEGNE